MRNEITASFDTLMNQATEVTRDSFDSAILYFDQQFGEGFAKAHPELLIAYVQSCRYDFRTTALLLNAQNLNEQLRSFTHEFEEFRLSYDHANDVPSYHGMSNAEVEALMASRKQD